MKKIFTLLILSVFSISLMANIVDREEARNRAVQFLNSSNPVKAKARSRQVKNIDLRYVDAGFGHLYVFNNGLDGGFVVVSADDRTESVLAYSESGCYQAEPEGGALLDILKGFDREVAAVSETGYLSAENDTEIQEPDRNPIYPLITTCWNQYDPYYHFCPMDPITGNRALVGCVATTLAQLMYYYQYPKQTTIPIPAYTTWSGIELPALPPTTFDYDLIQGYYAMDVLDPNYAPEQLEAVQKLLKYAGYALKMEYSSEGSASNFNVETIAKYFGYRKDARMLYAAQFPHATWEEMVYNELASGRPVPFNSGEVLQQTHSFIVDGYDGRGYFHAVTGMFGEYMGNVYCKLHVINECEIQTGPVEASGYNIYQAAYFGFQPENSDLPLQNLPEAEDMSGKKSAIEVESVHFYNPYAGQKTAVEIKHSNRGETYENGLFLFLGDKLIGGAGSHVPPGQKGDVLLCVASPEEPGSYPVRITSDWEGENVLYETVMEIVEMPRNLELSATVTQEGIKGLYLNYETSDDGSRIGIWYWDTDWPYEAGIYESLKVEADITNTSNVRYNSWLTTVLGEDFPNENGFPTYATHNNIVEHLYYLDLAPGETKHYSFFYDKHLFKPDMIYTFHLEYNKSGYRDAFFSLPNGYMKYFPTIPSISVSSITLNAKKLEMKVGETSILTATVLPDNATDKSVTWTSTDNTIASVDDDGKVTAKKAGKAVITAKSVSNPDVVASCEVTVVQPVTEVTLDATSIEFNEVGETYQLNATVLPEDANNKSVTWRSSDKSVCTVSETGLVTAVGSGTATVTVTTVDGGKTATCEVTVTISVSSITLNAKKLEMQVGETSKLTATVLPDNATDKSVTWTSSDNTIASVDDDGKVTAKKAGKAVITAKSVSNPDVVASCEVTVVQPVTGVTLDVTSIQLEEAGATYQLTATVLPEDANNKSVTWKSSDKSVCTVSETGLVTAVGSGTATVTVTTVDGGKTATCEVTVVDDDGILALTIGDMQNVRAIYDVTGRKIEQLQHGIYILLLNDGTTKKIILK